MHCEFHDLASLRASSIAVAELRAQWRHSVDPLATGPGFPSEDGSL